MKTLLYKILLLFVLFISSQNFGQCPVGNITLNSQDSVNQFFTNYSNCTTISGNLTVSGNNIISLYPLRNLTSISGTLSVSNTSIPNLSGLNNLTSIGNNLNISNNNLSTLAHLSAVTSVGGGIAISSENGISSLQGLQNINSISGILSIQQNSSLTSLQGLDGLTQIGNGFNLYKNNGLTSLQGLNSVITIGANITIDDNDGLISLEGLEGITEHQGNIIIQRNNALNSLDGLDNLSSVGGSFRIGYTSGAVEAISSIQSLSNLISVGGDFSIISQPNLVSIEGLGNLSLVDGSFNISLLIGLTSLEPLSNLTSVGGIFNLSTNNSLTNLEGLESLTSIGGLGINSNNSLNSLEALGSVDFLTGNLSISGNSNLTSLQGLEGITVVGGDVSITSSYLESVQGLDNLISIEGHFDLYSNGELSSIEALDGITSVGDYLRIQSNDSLTSLLGLNSLNSVGDSFSIQYNDNLTSFQGLENLSSIGSSVFIRDNNSLTSLQGLEGITHVLGLNLEIVNNPNLSSLQGLNNLTSTDWTFRIENNPSLTTLQGLESLITVGTYFYILNNTELISLQGINSLTSIGEVGGSGPRLLIENNSLLSICSLDNICEYIDNGGSINASNNNEGCNSLEEIQSNCGTLICPIGNLIFNSQYSINQFIIDYPFCAEINGDLIIGSSDGNTDISDLSSLENIHNINGNLTIYNNPLLNNLEGLNALQNIDGNLTLGTNNLQLSDILALSNLETINGSLQVLYNPNLSSLNGLESIDPTTISGDFGLYVVGNEILSVCDLSNFCEYLGFDETAFPRTISGNAEGCVSELEIAAACFGELCPEGNLTFSSQAVLDQFIADYPYCTELPGNVFINGGTITDLSPLENITRIEGSLTIHFCSNLTSLEPLGNLESVGGDVYISTLINLTNLNGLQNIAQVGGSLSVVSNNSLTNLVGLEGITAINNNYIYIANNTSLTNLTGIQNINLDNLTHLYLQSNANLSTCNTLPNICEYLYNGGIATISGNTGECNASETLVDSCPTTWNGNYWNLDEPDSERNAVIEGNLTLEDDLTSKNLILNSGTLTLRGGTSFTIQEVIENNAEAENFIVESDANLIQIENSNNIGFITVLNENQPFKRLDYTMWSSPVIAQNLFGFSPNTVNGVTNHVGSEGRIYIYDGTNGFVNPTPFTAEAIFGMGTGYLFRAPNNWSSDVPTAYEGRFIGEPFNGNLNLETHSGSFTSVGNPYPSNISADDFILANPGVLTLYFWNNTNSTGNNYATCVFGNCVAASGGGNTPNGIISVGQGFIVETNDASVNFTNEMRIADAATFFKIDKTERHRFWLNLTDGENQYYNQILVAYMTGATNEIDHQIDGQMFGYEGSALYNTINEEKFIIQGRALPFSNSDVVTLGFRAETAGKFSISLADFDGLFSEGEIKIYLKDKMLDITHNLMESAYTFESNEGIYKERFEIVYEEDETMGTVDSIQNSVQIYKDNNQIIVNSKSEKILSVELFDLQGRTIYRNDKVNANIYKIKSEIKGVLVVKIQTESGKIITKKLIAN